MATAAKELKAQARSGVGKGAARALRREGLIPAVIYGDKKAPVPISISYNEAMKSIYGGVGWFRWGTNTGLLLLPVVTLLQPILGVALALTLLIQGYVSVRLGIMEARSQRDLGIAGVIGAVLAIKGAGWAFAIGVGLCALIYGARMFRGENDQTFTKDLPPAE